MDQTVLSLDQNLLEGLENRTQMKKITLRTIYIKMCCLLLNFLNAFEIENSMSLWWNLIKILYGQYGQTMPVLYLDQNLLETLSNSTQIEACVILIMTGQSLLNGQHGSTCIVPD